MNIPDYISPVIAYRVWQWDSAGLKSLNNERWLPGEALQAKCRAGVALAHGAPGDCCSCGVYAAKDFDHLRRIGYLHYGVHGEVYLWGTVVEHKLGWRAQYAYPKSIILPPDTIPFKMSEVESRLGPLLLYAVEISIASAASAPIPLWSKRSGYNEAGLECLLEKRKRWYSYREEEHKIKSGDRVAVLGQGIGVVTFANGDDVHVVMWNKVALRISSKRVAWNQQNWRWEADGTGTFARKMICHVPSVGCHARSS
jgi:hypothetical protein